MSFTGKLDIYEAVKVLWFSYMEEVVCNRDDLILNPFNFEPMKGLEYSGDVKMLGSAGKSISNVLKALNLSDG